MSTSSSDNQTLSLRVVAARWEAESITSYEFTRADGGELPAWEPGAHVDVHLPSGTVRQYSLCGDPADSARYRIAVLELPAGRGGSVEVHRELRPGRLIEVGRPRSNFALTEADRYVFVAGGIGITPMLPMIREVQRRGETWELVYGARTAEHFAFVNELDASAVKLVPQDTSGHLDLEAIVASSAGAAVYCCGPTPLMDSLIEHMTRADRTEELHLERFAAAAPAIGSSGEFEVELARSEKVVPVRPNQTVLEAVRAAGIDHPSSCEMGICGSCEVKVLGGDVDHRDDLLTDTERAQCNSMMICVSRVRGDRLVLDL
ncbi:MULTISPECIES: PDR/VanB family oxidoreductase [unclassified Rhodococcus (in: high G+C Gram-positive bacteria)]|uniref:PDR/VanB family oxidoreductase n=1 Tax=unclassified Rhodococcus (in: high G+C Gram-positive bacteria) TaxID=192944 RepID=UPI0002FF1DB4|nr:PDR/VanB family oxidoreductase [Rhodococcus sp. DK17]